MLGRVVQPGSSQPLSFAAENTNMLRGLSGFRSPSAEAIRVGEARGAGLWQRFFAPVRRPAARLALLSIGALLITAPAHADALRLQLKWKHGFHFAGYYAAIAQGYYQEEGLQVELVEARPGVDAVANVLGGRATYGIGSSSLLLARAEGKPVVALAAIFQHSPLVLAMRRSGGAASVQDLVGKQVMIEPFADELYAYLGRDGVSRDQMQIVPHDFDVRSLIDGKVDAMSIYLSNEVDALNKAGFDYQLLSPVAAGIDFYSDVLFTSEHELNVHPDRVRRFRAASLRGWKYAMNHPDDMIDLILSRYPGSGSREHLSYEANALKALIRPELIEPGHMNPGRWQDIVKVYAQSGTLPKDFSLQGFLYAPEPEADLDHLYFLLGIAFISISIVGALALYIHTINRRLKRTVGDLENARRALEDEKKKLLASEERLTDFADELGLQNSILKLLQDSVALPEVLRTLALSVEALHPEMVCSVLIFSESDRTLYTGAAPSLPDFFSEAVNGLPAAEGIGSCGTAAARDELVVVENISEHPFWTPFREIAARAGVQACWSQPIHSSDHKLLGTFAIYHRRPTHPSESDLTLIRHFSWLAGIAIEKTRSSERIRLSEEQLRFVLEAAELGFWDWDIKAGTIVRNERWATMLGYTQEEMGEQAFMPTFLVHPDDVAKVQRSIDDVLGGQSGAHQIEYRMLHKDGSVRWILDHGNVTQRDVQGRPARMCGTHIDITERKLVEERTRQLAFFDPLTGLPNRRLLSDRLRQIFSANARHLRYSTLMLLDLDNFKPLNDRYGHAAGDQLLVELARRLQSCIRAEDTAARLGGDEFVVVINELGDTEARARQQAMAVAEKIRWALDQPYVLRIGETGNECEIQHRCSTSIGLALFAGTGNDETTIVNHADRAMYQAKQAGKNAIRIHEPEPVAGASGSAG